MRYDSGLCDTACLGTKRIFVIFICGIMNVSLFNSAAYLHFFAHVLSRPGPKANVLLDMRAITLCYRLRYRAYDMCAPRSSHTHTHTLLCALRYAHKSCGPCRACLRRVFKPIMSVPRALFAIVQSRIDGPPHC